MQITKIAVLGGTGFVGSALVHRLSNAGYIVNVITRRRENAKHLILLPNLQVTEFDIFGTVPLNEAVKGSDAVINLVGILHESKTLSFNDVHAEFPRRLAEACKSLSIKRLIHLSALKADPEAPSAYLRSKYAGENALGGFSDQLNVTILRPSVIFGRGDGFLNLFAKLIKLLPVVFLAMPHSKFQPIYVEDIANVILLSIDNVDTFGQSYDLGGPKVYSLIELVNLTAKTLHVKRTVIGLNGQLSYLQALFLEMLPVKLMTRDNINSMKVDSVTNKEFPLIFEFQPTSLESTMSEFLLNDRPRASYDRFRELAGR